MEELTGAANVKEIDTSRWPGPPGYGPNIHGIKVYKMHLNYCACNRANFVIHKFSLVAILLF